MTRAWRLAVDRGYLLALLALGLYLALAPATIVGGDNPEMAALAVLPGRAHPSGYPLYLLWLRATAWLPGQSVAHTAALATCLLAALAVLALHAACRAWGARPLAATLACALFAASPVVLIIHTEAEVFALNALAVACVLCLAAPAGPARGARRAVLLGLVAGLGLANHVSCALVAPVGIYGVICGVREAAARAPLVVAATVGAFAIALLPYLQTLFAGDSAASWGQGDGLGDLVAHVLRSEYGATSLSARGGDALPTANLLAFGKTLGRAFWWLPLGLALVTLGVRAARRVAPGSRAPWLALAASWLLAGPLFVARFNIDPAGFGLHIVQRMHLLPCLLLVIPLAVGLDWLGRARLGAASALWGVVAVPLLVVPSLGAATAEHSPAVERSLIDTLRALPPNAALITDGDDYNFGIPYVQAVLGVRPDVIAINWPALKLPWAQARLRARGVAWDPQAAGPDPASVRLADYLNATGHPVFVDDFEANILRARASYPFVGLLAVLAPAATPPGLDAIALRNASAFEHFDLAYPAPGPDDGFVTLVHLRYAETWTRIAALYRRAGFPEQAAAAEQRAVALAPVD